MTKAIKLASSVLALLCLLAFIPWTLGVPGTENEYARGWRIGYYAICCYLLGMAVIIAIELVMRWRQLPGLRPWLDGGRLVLMVGFAVAQVWAWMLILR